MALVERRRPADRRRPARHDRRGGPRAAGALPQRATAQEPVRVRDPPAVAGVLQQGRAARARSPGCRRAVVIDVVEKAARVRAAVHLQPRHRHHVADRRRGRGLAHLRRRHAQGADGAQPGVHLRAAAAAAEIARKLGAQVMGLGAFTKVVGDAGVTVAKQAPLPITTGNSYSASGALWAAHEAVRGSASPRSTSDGRIRRPGHGGRRHRCHRLGVRAAAGARQRRALAGLARDRPSC